MSGEEEGVNISVRGDTRRLVRVQAPVCVAELIHSHTYISCEYICNISLDDACLYFWEINAWDTSGVLSLCYMSGLLQFKLDKLKSFYNRKLIYKGIQSRKKSEIARRQENDVFFVQKLKRGSVTAEGKLFEHQTGVNSSVPSKNSNQLLNLSYSFHLI